MYADDKSIPVNRESIGNLRERSGTAVDNAEDLSYIISKLKQSHSVKL